MPRARLVRLLNYIRPYRRSMFFASICSILNQLFDICPEILLGIAVDVVAQPHDSFLARFGFADPMIQLALLGAISLIAWTFEAVFQYLYAILWRNLAQTVQHQIRMDAYTHIQNLEVAYFEDQNTGELLSILNDDVNQLERFLDSGINTILQLVTSTCVTGMIFLYVSPTITFFTLAPTPFIIMLSFIFRNRLASLYASVRQQAGRVGSRLANNISAITTIKSYVTEMYEVRRLNYSSKHYKRINKYTIGVSAAFRPVIRMAIVLGFVATIIIGGKYTIDGYLSIGAYSTLVYLTQRLLWPFSYLAETINDYERGMACVKRILDLIEKPVTIKDGYKNVPLADIKGAISFNNVSFMYPNQRSLFESFSLDIPAGSTIAFVGPTGSGKSSLIKLLLRFYDSDNGNILLDNTNIKDFSLKALRQAISLVSQETFLFSGTIYDNIAYGSPHSTIEQVVQAAKIAQAHDFIMHLCHGYQSLVGQQGQKLSGGQRQRISIARAILKNPRIFIFDEATSAVDNETESAIQRSLEQIAKGHTTIIIAHRLSTIKHADLIHFIRNGAIVESGSHEQLVALNGMYNHLWNIQTGKVR